LDSFTTNIHTDNISLDFNLYITRDNWILHINKVNIDQSREKLRIFISGILKYILFSDFHSTISVYDRISFLGIIRYGMEIGNQPS